MFLQSWAAHRYSSLCCLYIAAVIVAAISSTHSACSCCSTCHRCSRCPLPVDHHHLPLPPDQCCYCRWTAIATDAGPPPRQPPPSAPMPLLLLMPPCHRSPPPTAHRQHLCHLTPAFADCHIFHCPIFSLA